MSKAQKAAVEDLLSKGITAPHPPRDIESVVPQGLRLTEEVYKPLSWFKRNPDNEIWQKEKTLEYWKALEKDIRESGVIRDPLIAMPDGLVISGESRLTISEKLVSEGLKQFERAPVKLVDSPLTPEQRKQIVYLENLSRFEISHETRVAAYIEIWPEYMLSEETSRAPGRPAQNDPTSRIEKQISQRTGRTAKTLQRDRAIALKAKAIAKKKGKPKPGLKEVKEALSRKNLERRTKTKPPASHAAPSKAFPINLGLTIAESEKVLVKLSDNPDSVTRKVIEKLRKARRAAVRKAS